MKIDTIKGIIENDYGYIAFGKEEEIEIDEEGNEAKDYDYIMIYNFFINKKHRGKGHARELMDAAFETIKKTYPELEVKIVAEPQEKDTDREKLYNFYSEYPCEVVV